jgi:hypothetical protein
MKSSVIRWVSVLLLAALSGCLTGSGTNQSASNFVISANSYTNLTDTSVTLMGGFMNTAGANASVTFEIGTTTAYGTSATPTIFSNAGYASVRQDFTSLTPNKTYHYRLKIVAGAATTYSADNTFTTLAALGVSTPVVSGVLNILSPNQIVMDAAKANIYWTELPSVDALGVATLGSVKMVAKAGGVVTSVTPVPAALTSPAGLAVDAAGAVYYVDNGVAVTLNQVAITAGVPVAPVILATLLSPAKNVAVDATNAYVSVRGTWDGVSKDANDGMILQVPQGVIAGGTLCAPTLTQAATFEITSATVAVGSGGSGYKAGEVLAVTDAAVVVGSLVVTGVDSLGAVTTLGVLNSGKGVTAAVFVAPTFATLGYAVATNLHGPDNLVSDGTNVYWSEVSNFEPGMATIKYAPVNLLTAGVAATFTPGSEKTIASGLSGVQYLALDGGYLYFTSGGGTISRVSTSALSGVPVVVVTNTSGVVQPFSIDGANIYWTEMYTTDAATGLLKRAPVAGGSNTVVASGLKNPGGVVVDGTTAYWLEKATANPLPLQDGIINSHAK